MAPDLSPVLKLRAEDEDDLAVLSACLQDALVAVRDLGYFAEEERFVFVANRFRWETGLRPLPGEEPHQRILCAVAFSAVTGVAYRGFRRADEDRILCLLAIRSEPAPTLPSPPWPGSGSGGPGDCEDTAGQQPAAAPPGLDTGAGAPGVGSGRARAIRLEFAGAAAIRLETSRILCYAKDLGEPWPTSWRPQHDEDAAK